MCFILPSVSVGHIPPYVSSVVCNSCLAIIKEMHLVCLCVSPVLSSPSQLEPLSRCVGPSRGFSVCLVAHGTVSLCRGSSPVFTLPRLPAGTGSYGGRASVTQRRSDRDLSGCVLVFS